MRADTTKRLFRAIALNSEKDIFKLCEKVITEENGIGHHNLAEQLRNILNNRSRDQLKASHSKSVNRSLSNISNIETHKEVSTLPRSRRNNELLANEIPLKQLRHHMILPPLVEERFQQVEKEYAARERLATHGLNNKKKILFYGPPGCGKTLGAERIAYNTGLPLIKVRFDAIISSYLGDSATNLRAIFERASAYPSVLLLDECDFIAKSRDMKNDVGEIPRIVNMLLTLLDEFSAPGLLIATTNLEKNLDTALFRRFDDVIEIPPPEKEERVKLLKLSLSSLRVESGLPWEEIAQEMAGCSAAAFVRVSEEAAKHSILQGCNYVRRSDLLKAVSEAYRSF